MKTQMKVVTEKLAGVTYRRWMYRFQSHDVNNPGQPRQHVILSPIIDPEEPEEPQKEAFASKISECLRYWAVTLKRPMRELKRTL